MLTYSIQGDSLGHQIEDGQTASASKLELAAIPDHVRDECVFALNFTKEAMLKKQQAFREELSDRVTELREEYESQLEDLDRQLQREKVAHHHTKTFNDFYLHLHSKREHSFQGEKRNEDVRQLQKDVYCLRRRVKDTEALKEELFRPVDYKEWVLQWFSTRNISKATGTLLEERYRNAMQGLDKIVARMEVLAALSDLVNQHTELLQYICSKLFKLDPNITAARSSPISQDRP